MKYLESGSDWFSHTYSANEIVVGCKNTVIPNGIKSIDDFAFSGCESLKKINIPEGVTDIGNSAFENTALTEITIPDSITNISYDIFQGCENLTSITWKGQTYNSASEFFGAFKTAYLEKNTK